MSQAHHDARRAIAALRTVVIHHRLLHRMQFAARCQIIDRDHILAVNLPEQLNAGIDRLIDQHAVFDAANRNCASAAIAFIAAFLGAFGTFTQPKIIQQHLARPDIACFGPHPRFWQIPDYAWASSPPGLCCWPEP